LNIDYVDFLFVIDSLTVADVPFFIEGNREKCEEVEGRTGPKRIHRTEFNPKVTEGRGRLTDGERRLKKVEDSSGERSKAEERREMKRRSV
jgi:hypothetical protein